MRLALKRLFKTIYTVTKQSITSKSELGVGGYLEIVFKSVFMKHDNKTVGVCAQPSDCVRIGVVPDMHMIREYNSI